MSNVKSAHSFLCGNFISSLTSKQIRKMDESWRPEIIQEIDRTNYYNIYYQGFVDAMIPLPSDGTNAPEGTVETLVMQIDRSCSIKLYDRDHPFHVDSIRLFLFPYDIKLFAITIREENCGFNRLMMCHYKLCHPTSYDRAESTKAFVNLLEPLAKLCGRPLTSLPVYGNKLKIFQIIRVEKITDELLYECGMLSGGGSASDLSSKTAPSAQYQQMLESRKLDIFNNWRALALLDTFTVLHTGFSSKDMQRWTDSYFRLIYIHALHIKTMLGIVNIRFRENGTPQSSLADIFNDFEFRFLFHKLSYNFLPQTIHNMIDRSQEIEDERRQTQEFMQRMTEAREKHRDKNLSKLILVLTLLTVFSTLNDGSQFIAGLIRDTPSLCVTRWTGGCLTGIIVLGISFLLFRWIRRK